MGVRASQIYTHVAGQLPQDGELRVRRIYADVLVATSAAGTHNEAASNNISFTELAHAWIEDKSFTSNMTLTDEALYVIFNQDQDVTDTLGLTDTAFGGVDRPVSVTQTLNLVSLGGRALTENVTSTLSISDVGYDFNVVADRQPCGSVLNLTQSVTTLSSLDVTSTLNLQQTVAVRGALRHSINQWLAIGQHTTTPYHVWVEDELVLTSNGYTPINVFVTINQTLNLDDSYFPFPTESTLNLTQTVLQATGLVVTQTISIEDSMVLEADFIRLVEDATGIGHSLTWYEDTPCAKKQYMPFQGENTIASEVSAPPSTLNDPQGSVTDRFALYQPPLGVRTKEVILRAPELDNRDRNAYTRVNRETRGGTLKVYADPQWPNVRTMGITIIGLLESEIDELQTFLQATVGQLIGICDWEGRLWQGFVTNPNEVATQDGKGMWTVIIEFEGDMLDVQQPGSEDGNGMILNLTQGVTAVIV